MAAAQESLTDLSDQWVHNALAQSEMQQTMPLRMEVQVGKLDPRLNLAPCLRMEPYLPSGSKLWGAPALACAAWKETGPGTCSCL